MSEAEKRLGLALEGLRAVLSDRRLWKHDVGCGCLMVAESAYLEAGGQEFSGAHYLRPGDLGKLPTERAWTEVALTRLGEER